MAILLATHNLGVVARVCDRVSVMYAGRLVESASVYDFFGDPKHPYSQGLIGAVSAAFEKRRRGPPGVPGRPPVFGELPPGCVFHPRCGYAMDICKRSPPPVVAFPDRTVRCWLYRLH